MHPDDRKVLKAVGDAAKGGMLVYFITCAVCLILVGLWHLVTFTTF